MNSTRREAMKAAVGIMPTSLFLAACGGSVSPLVAALEAIAIAADVGTPVLEILNPQAAQWLSLVPGAVTAALDIAEGSSAISMATAAIAELQQIWNKGEILIPQVNAQTAIVISAILAAVQTGIALFQQEYGTPVSQQAAAAIGYARGVLDSPNPKTAKVKKEKLSRKDRKAIADARSKLADLQNKLTTTKK